MRMYLTTSKCLEARLLLFFSWCPVLLNFLLLRYQMYLYSNPVVYPGCYGESQPYVCSSNTESLFHFSDYLRKLEGNYLEFTTYVMLLMLIL
jgi:hypothetical protein